MIIEKKQVEGKPLTVVIEYPQWNDSVENLVKKISLVLSLFGLSFIISLANYFMDEYVTLPILAGYVVKYILATGIVMLFGFIAGWFYKSNYWMAFIYVGIVLVLAYFVDAIKTKHDIDYIISRIDRIRNRER